MITLPTLVMEMPASFQAANSIPGHGVRHTFIDLQIAMRANPSLCAVCICPVGALNGVLDTLLYFCLSDTKPNQVQIQFRRFLLPFLRSARTITSGHLIPSNLIRVNQCRTWILVTTLNVLHSPSDLSFSVSQPVGSLAGHLASRQ